jgi:hypothetical protein
MTGCPAAAVSLPFLILPMVNCRAAGLPVAMSSNCGVRPDMHNSTDCSGPVALVLPGVLLASSEYRHALETDIEPFKGLLLGLFFISVEFATLFSLYIKQYTDQKKKPTDKSRSQIRPCSC